MSNATRRFKTIVQSGERGRVFIALPFDPSDVWGKKQRHHIRGTVNGMTIRGSLGSDGETFFLPLGAAWRRDCGVKPGDVVTVELYPEGPQQELLAPDIASALNAEPAAAEFFVSLATFYRNTYIKWIESAKRPETRSARIAEMMALLRAGKKQR
jgi:hypothetical protein